VKRPGQLDFDKGSPRPGFTLYVYANPRVEEGGREGVGKLTWGAGGGAKPFSACNPIYIGKGIQKRDAGMETKTGRVIDKSERAA